MIRCKYCQLSSCTCGREDWEEYMTGGEAKGLLVEANEQIKQLTAENTKLKAALEKLLNLDDTSYLTQIWGLSSEQIKVINEALKETK